MHSFPVLIALRGRSNKRDQCDEVREGYSGASITHLELVFVQTDDLRPSDQIWSLYESNYTTWCENAASLATAATCLAAIYSNDHWCELPKATRDALLNAPSMGQYFNANIKADDRDENAAVRLPHE